MRTEKNNFKKLINIILIGFILSSCALLKENTKRKEQAKELLEKQKKNFTSLQTDLKSRKISLGITSDEIKLKYGEPTDTFGTASVMSQFQMWTYDYPDASKKESFQPIRLYFNNNKLTYWTN
jgi:hypothetical protein